MYTPDVVAARRDPYQQLLEEIRAEFPGFRVRRKEDDRLQRAIHRALMILTFGRMKRYLTDYQTTIGWTVYVSADWEERPRDQRWITMRHEREHLRQFKRWTRPLMALLYLLIPLPVGLAYFRARFEKQAYREGLRAQAELEGIDAIRAPELRARIVRKFTGPDYGWMWPFPRAMARWYDRTVDEIAAEIAA
jgi:hypothetical protein